MSPPRRSTLWHPKARPSKIYNAVAWVTWGKDSCLIALQKSFYQMPSDTQLVTVSPCYSMEVSKSPSAVFVGDAKGQVVSFGGSDGVCKVYTDKALTREASRVVCYDHKRRKGSARPPIIK